MTDQPANKPDAQGFDPAQPGVPPSGYEPPAFVPPYGSDAPPVPPYGANEAPPLYGQGHGPAGYQAPQGSAHGDQYASNRAPTGQYGNQYAAGPYAQPGSPFGAPGSPYAPQGYYGMAPQPKTLSIASMVCGIASVLVGWLMIPQIAAIITGHMALKREPAGKGMSITGLVLGYLCLLGYGAFWLLLIIGLTYASSSSYGY
ncbi:hypothetical protein ACU18_01230 [Arthrobacter sp. ZBG10]|uniref:DUF4190 domain-containing protein n=1 Tax=Arthrobacter sp. ZBG10 TaxID=1676590 RepID=UPI0006807AA0|nr:DUF4190 domain-containing protein [Arthrobacter sp. ZBG10]KNH22517.1 hypothetical protein ACU18_01230 [Arthrobacter sp. ZBG10]